MKLVKFLLLFVVMYILGQLYAQSQINDLRSCIEHGRSEAACVKEYNWQGKIPLKQ